MAPPDSEKALRALGGDCLLRGFGVTSRLGRQNGHLGGSSAGDSGCMRRCGKARTHKTTLNARQSGQKRATNGRATGQVRRVVTVSRFLRALGVAVSRFLRPRSL